MFCNQCGQDNRNDRKFCSNCGAQLRDYTKPRENLVMPDDVSKEKETIVKRKKSLRILKIVMYLFCLIAIGCAIMSFVKNDFRNILLICCFVSFVLSFVLQCIVRFKEKKLYNLEK